MSFEMKDGQGSLFKVKEKKNENGPDYEGKCLVGGVNYRIAGWIKQGPKAKWMSLKIDLPLSHRTQDGKIDPDGDIDP